MHYKL